jgi:hypothetical protein
VARAPKAGIDVTVNEAPAIAGLKRLTKEFGSTAVAINQAAELGLKAWGAITGVIGGAVSAVVDATKASMEVERIQRRALAGMQARAGMSREEFDALSALNDERERQLNIDADEQLQLQGTLAALGVRKEALNAATEATIGLSAVTGQGLAEAGKKVTQVLHGNVNALKELGITASSAADAQRQLQDLFVLAQAQADTLETRIAAVGHAYGTMTETIGGLVTDSAELKKGLDAVTTALTEINDYLSSAEGKQAAREFFGVMLELASDTIDSLLGVYRIIQELRGEGDRESAMSRAGGALSLVQQLNPTALAWRAFTGEVEESRAAIGAAYDQMLGRGVGSADAPIIATIEQLSNRLRQAAADASRVPEPKLLHADGTPYGSKPGDKGYVPPRVDGGSAGDGRKKAGEEMGPGISISYELDFGQNEIEQQRFQAMKERRIENARLAEFERGIAEREAYRSEFEQRMALMQELHDRGLEFEHSMSTERLEQTKAEADARQQILQSATEQTTSILSQQMTQMVVSVASGEKSLGEALKSFVGGIVTSLGTMLIQLGTAAIAVNLLSVVPVLWGKTGLPGVGVAAGLKAIAIGAGMVALGSAMGGGGARAGAGAPPRAGGGGGGSAPRASSLDTGRGFMPSFAMAGAGAQPYTVNVNFNGVVGDERRAARMIEDTLRRGR